MPLTVIRRAIEKLPPTVQFINAFGQTETASTVTMLGPDDHRLSGDPREDELKLRRLASIGRPLPDVELCILSAEGEPLAAGQVGEVSVRTSRTMRGYYGQEEATSRALQGGWLRTGDLGWMDEGGYIFLTGRKSDLIIRGGENIAPEEIELVLVSHPEVDEAAVVGLPDEEWGEREAAIVVPSAGAALTAEVLSAFCHERLASFKKPEIIVFAEALPRNTMGKVLRTQLRAELAEHGASVG
jgi:acyl-CoA synthetase (AMP-forming)/AMP-acid ligase II